MNFLHFAKSENPEPWEFEYPVTCCLFREHMVVLKALNKRSQSFEMRPFQGNCACLCDRPLASRHPCDHNDIFQLKGNQT